MIPNIIIFKNKKIITLILESLNYLIVFYAFFLSLSSSPIIANNYNFISSLE